MKAALIQEAGQAPSFVDFPAPQVRPGYELVTVVASAIHPVVRAKASGGHYSSTGRYPLIPGVDAVVRTREGALAYTGGAHGPYGTFAESFLAPLTLMSPLPEDADIAAVAAGMNPGMASWMPLTSYYAEHGAPTTVMILGATGTAGSMAIQNARLMGASTVIGTGRDPHALARAEALGADTVGLTGDHDADTDAIASALTGKMPDLTLDFLWGSAAESAFAALASLSDSTPSHYVEIGGAAGPEARIPAALLRSRPFRLTGSGIGSFDMARYRTVAPDYVTMLAHHEVTIDTALFPLSQVTEAWHAGPSPRPVITMAPFA